MEHLYHIVSKKGAIMVMENKFSFNGVGQGLFYSGSICNNAFNFVYDCGSMSSDKSVLKSAISALHNELDFVVISHLHDDHVNGLPEVFEKAHIKKIFLPYFNVKAYRDVFIASLISGDILPNTPTFSILLRLYEVEIDINIYDEALSETGLARIKDVEKVFCEENRPFDHEKWQFRFYNRKIDDRFYKKLNDKLQDILAGRTIEQYISEINGNFKELREAYNKILNHTNMSSLLLMHWDPLNPIKKTLLTGDVKFDQDLEECLHRDISHSDEIVLQVPHHGATTEWQSVPQYIDNRASDIILSFGLKNTYHHPSIKKLMSYYNDSVLWKKIKFVFEGNSYPYYI